MTSSSAAKGARSLGLVVISKGALGSGACLSLIECIEIMSSPPLAVVSDGGVCCAADCPVMCETSIVGVLFVDFDFPTQLITIRELFLPLQDLL